MDCVNEARKQQRPLKSRLGFKAAAGPPYVTYALIAVNAALYLVAPALLGANWVLTLGLWPDYVPQLAAVYPGAGDEWWRWITSGFAHFGLLHIGLNMFVLFQFGAMLEPALGRARYAALYGGSLLGSSAVVLLLGDQGSVHGGASGAIFGLLAAYAIVLRKLRLPYQSHAMFAGGWLLAGFFISGLSWQGHLGGAVVGAIIMAAMFRSVERSPAKGRQR